MATNCQSTFYTAILPPHPPPPEIYASRAKEKTNKVIQQFFVNKTLPAASTPIILLSHQVQTSYSPVILTSAEEILKVEKKPNREQFHHFLKIFGAACCSCICQTMKTARRNAKILGAWSPSLIKKPNRFSRCALYLSGKRAREERACMECHKSDKSINLNHQCIW